MNRPSSLNSSFAFSCIFFLLATLLFASPSQSAEIQERSLSLKDCVEIALADNLTLQIESYQPQFELTTMSAVKGGYYDPVYSFNYSLSETSSPSGSFIQGTAQRIDSFEQQSDRFSSGLNGQLPTGANYDISGSLNEVNTLSDDPQSVNYSGNFQLRLTQPLLKNAWIDQGRLNIKLQTNIIDGSILDYQRIIENVIFSVEQAYHGLIAAEQTVAVQEKAVELAERLLMENRKRVEIGTMAPLDEKQAEAQVASSRASLLEQQRQRIVAQTRLKNLLSSDFMMWAEVEIQPTEELSAVPSLVDLQTSWSRGMELRKDLQSRELSLTNRGLQLKFAKNQLLPQLDLFATAGWRGQDFNTFNVFDTETGPKQYMLDSETGEVVYEPAEYQVRRVRTRNAGFGNVTQDILDRSYPSWTTGFALSMPLTRTREKANYRAAKMEMDRSVAQYKQFEQNILVDIENDVAGARIAFQRVEATRQEREFAEAALGAEEKKLEVGKSTSFIVLQLQRDLTTARSNEINALTDYNIALAQLAYSEGRTLEKHGIEVETIEEGDDNAEVNPLLLPYISN